MDELIQQSDTREKRLAFLRRYKFHLAALFAVVGFFALVLFSLRPPRDFPAPTIITIERGSSLIGMAGELKRAHIIRSETAFQMLAIVFSGDTKLAAGDFAFENKEPVYVVAWRIAKADFGIARKKITIPEGSTVRDIAAITGAQLIDFDRNIFIDLAKDKEGYLFPDTYFFFLNAKPDEVVAVLHDNFMEKTKTLAERTRLSSRTFSDIITMASIIETEANKPADRRVVAGVLWKRLDDGMRLQVDAPFFFLRQESAEQEVTVDDLKTDSLYNTYLHKGLPPGPIGNPGLDSIVAALEPQSSPYWYYLYDKNGVIHYARTFEEHKANKAKYLQ